MVIKVKLDPGAFMPVKAHADDAGFDLKIPNHLILIPGDGNQITINTGVHMAIPSGYYGRITSKSSLNVIGVCCDGVIDSGYTGSIRVTLFNRGKERIRFEPGQKIAQIIIEKIELPALVRVGKLEDTERGDGGFGSTGK